MKKSDVLTPALLLDLDKFEANIKKMQSAVSGAGKRLRPHFKAHKCVEIARRQIEAGAVGVCVATMAELELISAAGIGALLTTPVASRGKTERVAMLAKSGADLSVVVDHPEQARLYQDSMSAVGAGAKLRVLVDLDIGDHRTGVPCDERALTLARAVANAPNLEFAGLQAYSVSGSHTDGWEARRAHSHGAIAQAIAVQRRLIEDGLDARYLTGGSTGTWNIDIEIPELSEMQAGSYPLMDVAYRKIGGVDFLPAMTIVTTVISHCHPTQATVDGGFKTFATDRPFGPEPVDLSGVRWQWAGDEHGILHLDNPSRAISLGDRLEFRAPHCDPTLNLHDRIYVIRDNEVTAVWPTKTV
jgi:D-serine deaminase-like pyridoxal phosphate-dependent protein